MQNWANALRSFWKSNVVLIICVMYGAHSRPQFLHITVWCYLSMIWIWTRYVDFPGCVFPFCCWCCGFCDGCLARFEFWCWFADLFSSVAQRGETVHIVYGQRMQPISWFFTAAVICLFSISLLQQGAAGQQQSGLSPIGIFWLPAGNSWCPLLLPVDLCPAGSPGEEKAS